jgi:hypothetical protein
MEMALFLPKISGITGPAMDSSGGQALEVRAHADSSFFNARAKEARVMTVRKIGAAIALISVLTAGVSAAPMDETKGKLLTMAATLTEMGKACGHLSAGDAEASKTRQRQAMLAQGVDAKSFDKAYDEAGADFRSKWATMPASQQQSACADMKKRSEQGAAQGRSK